MRPTTVCGAPAGQVSGICVGAVTDEPGSRTRGVRISRLTVRGFPGAGVLLFGTRSAQVVSSTLSANGNGVLGLYDRGSAISDNQTDQNSSFGVALIFSERARLVGNRARGNVAGLEVANSTTGDVLLDGNRATGNLYGILIADASHGRISRNTLEGNCAGLIIAAEGGPGVRDWTVDHNLVRANDRVCVPGHGDGAGRLRWRHRPARSAARPGQRQCGARQPAGSWRCRLLQWRHRRALRPALRSCRGPG